MPISFEQIQERRGVAEFAYFGEDVHIEFWVERITGDFRAETLRLDRQMTRLVSRQDDLVKRVMTVKESGDDEAGKLEEAEAEAAIQLLVAENRTFKQRLSQMICDVVAEWDVLGEDGDMLPLTIEQVSRIAPHFLGRALGEITKAATSGEGRTTPSGRPSKPGLKPRGLVSMKKASSSRHRVG